MEKKSPIHYYKKKYFLQRIGLSSNYIYTFLQDLTYEQITILTNLEILRLYLKKYDVNFVEHENEIFNLMNYGFSYNGAYDLYDCIKDVYKMDITINWIYIYGEYKEKLKEKLFKKYVDDIKRKMN